ncbi:MAG: hypothetical protein RL535_401 [Pseudomonadota bacterium]
MKAAVLKRYGDNTGIQIENIPLPTISDTDLLVEVRSASINPLDVKTRDGKVKILLKYSLPIVLGNDLAGVVVQVGKQVNRFKVGDEIYARLDKGRIGAFAEFAVVRECDAALRPKNTTFEEAASLPLVALTAWQALVDIGKLKADQRVLIHAGSGGVGSIAIQIAHHLGAKVFTTAGKRNFDLVKRLGADTLIDYKSERFEDIAKDCDVVLDSAGGETLVRSFKCIKPGGVVISIGGTPSAKFAQQWGLNPFLVFVISLMSRKVSKAARSSKSDYEYLFMRPDGDQLKIIAGLVEDNIIKPQIDRVFELEQVKEALSYSESGRATGKIVVKIS